MSLPVSDPGVAEKNSNLFNSQPFIKSSTASATKNISNALNTVSKTINKFKNTVSSTMAARKCSSKHVTKIVSHTGNIIHQTKSAISNTVSNNRHLSFLRSQLSQLNTIDYAAILASVILIIYFIFVTFLSHSHSLMSAYSSNPSYSSSPFSSLFSYFSSSDLVYSKTIHGAGPQKYVYNDAATLSVTHSPYIYPNLAELEEFRRTGRVDADGLKVFSRTHAIVYKPAREKKRWFWNSSKTKNGNVFKGNNNNNKMDREGTDLFEKQHNNPPLVLVVGLDAKRYPRKYLEWVIQDRLKYAQLHGYGLYIRYLQDFEAPAAAASSSGENPTNLEFAKIALMREAMFAFATSAWFWWLDQDAVITNHTFDIGSQLVFNKQKLSQQMLRDTALIPPQSAVHTYKHTAASQVRLIVQQNDMGIDLASFVIRQDPLFGHMLMEYLMDPVHREYQGFQSVGKGKVLNFAVTHMLQWHPLILSRTAVIRSVLGAYPEGFFVAKGGSFRKGDFVYLLKSSLINNRGVLDVDFIMDEWRNVGNYKS